MTQKILDLKKALEQSKARTQKLQTELSDKTRKLTNRRKVLTGVWLEKLALTDANAKLLLDQIHAEIRKTTPEVLE